LFIWWDRTTFVRIRSWIKCFETNFTVNQCKYNFQFLKPTFRRLLVTGLTLYWKYHAPDESFENRNFCIKLSKFCIKLSKLQSRKNRYIGIFFPVSVFVFFQISQQPRCHQKNMQAVEGGTGGTQVNLGTPINLVPFGNTSKPGANCYYPSHFGQLCGCALLIQWVLWWVISSGSWD
jgi:hypothetical protein